jgi:hypothetical protein
LVFESAGNGEGQEPGEAQLTPIFDALAQLETDPVEHFRRDPLCAPLPPPAAEDAPAPAVPKMLLYPVAAADDGGGRHRPGRVAGGGRHRALRSVRYHRIHDEECDSG